MSNHDCAHRGHHFHESDGAIFNRKRNVANRDVIDVHCCFCGAPATKSGYGARNAPTDPSTIACGEFVTL